MSTTMIIGILILIVANIVIRNFVQVKEDMNTSVAPITSISTSSNPQELINQLPTEIPNNTNNNMDIDDFPSPLDNKTSIIESDDDITMLDDMITSPEKNVKNNVNIQL
jgi:hypothetical protein